MGGTRPRLTAGPKVKTQCRFYWPSSSATDKAVFCWVVAGVNCPERCELWVKVPAEYRLYLPPRLGCQMSFVSGVGQVGLSRTLLPPFLLAPRVAGCLKSKTQLRTYSFAIANCYHRKRDGWLLFKTMQLHTPSDSKINLTGTEFSGQVWLIPGCRQSVSKHGA